MLGMQAAQLCRHPELLPCSPAPGAAVCWGHAMGRGGECVQMGGSGTTGLVPSSFPQNRERKGAASA